MKKKFYHATSKKSLEWILKWGFESTSGDCGTGVYFFDNLQSARDFAWRHAFHGSAAIIVEISSSELQRCLDVLGGYPEDWEDEDRPYYEHIWIFPTEDEGETWKPKIIAIHELKLTVPNRWKREVLKGR